MTCHFIIYNVKLGQCIGVLPDDQPDHAMMVDCGHDGDFHPIDDFGRYLNKIGNKPSLRTLALTNYDHDHFSGLPKLYKSAKIESVLLPKNLGMKEIRALKSESTDALDTLEHIRSTYTVPIRGYTRPFTRKAFSLEQMELTNAGIPIETNHLSQMMFVKYGQTTFCIPGDLECRSWELMLAKPDVQDWLRQTNVLMAPHHGRENGYHEDIFNYCNPACVIFSDKPIVHGTQRDMIATYASHADGITYTTRTGDSVQRRTLTTRNDGHILVTVPLSGAPTFKAY
ncbi:hypothetical protein HF285_04745 [Acidithiobacillus ferrooxidans F221]|uniref:MBL fold metallo-hydrolase n=1 Tax=Acidithiobacillus ferrooxidans TaxID=920 RepID=UPI001C069582|nr:MBL fold metallo-hydrolase [Acidithiobacillus ferrooxidans]MBU2807590.1 hypothetical protein [Acidithiobacillus ferrooxidans F221]